MLNKLCVFSLLFALIFAAAAFAAPEDPIGVAVGVHGEVLVTRGGETARIALKDPLTVSDIVSTGADGKIKILLRDDTAITLSGDSELALAEFEDIGESPAFSARFVKGTLRVITGKITETNPGGFKITTPHATVGIRGTILGLTTNDRSTTLQVLNTDKAVIFNGADIYENFKAVAERGRAPRISPLSRNEKENAIREMVINPENTGGSDKDSEETEGEEFSGDRTPGIWDADTSPLDVLPNTNLIVSFSGNIAETNPFSFDLNLRSGSITNAAASGNYGDFTWDLRGGSGELCTDGFFEIANFGGTATATNGSLQLNSSQTWLSGNYGSAGHLIIDGTFQLTLEDSLSPAFSHTTLPASGGIK
ncbi:MAG: FecR family protein [Deferribacteraceae bacterium]|jgi:hypothetical protein|nr:FecR family protein [Deferribacteraceae bacterium]